MATSTSFSSSSSSSSTRPLTGKSPLRGSRTPETVSQYSFHIVNAAGITCVRALIHQGFGFSDLSSTSSTPPSSLLPRMVIIYAKRKHRHLSSRPSHFHPPGAIPGYDVLSGSFSRLEPVFAYRLSLHISFDTGDRTPRISSLSSWQSSRWILHARICTGETLL